jgi:hypothetical protein
MLQTAVLAAYGGFLPASIVMPVFIVPRKFLAGDR